MADQHAECIQQARQGDREALRKLLEEFGPQVWSEIQSDIGAQWRASIDADDVMQVTYIEAFLQVDRLAAADGAGFAAWLRRIARNNLRDAIKELGRKKRPNPAQRLTAGGHDSCVALIHLLGETHGTPSRHVAAREVSAILTEMLERLPGDYGAVVRLYDLEGRDIANVAQTLGRSPGAVHMLRRRAHDRLREMLGAETNFFSHAT